jgi:hypothetical protein
MKGIFFLRTSTLHDFFLNTYKIQHHSCGICMTEICCQIFSNKRVCAPVSLFRNNVHVCIYRFSLTPLDIQPYIWFIQTYTPNSLRNHIHLCNTKTIAQLKPIIRSRRS